MFKYTDDQQHAIALAIVMRQHDEEVARLDKVSFYSKRIYQTSQFVLILSLGVAQQHNLVIALGGIFILQLIFSDLRSRKGKYHV
jgi:hypothetical protein